MAVFIHVSCHVVLARLSKAKNHFPRLPLASGFLSLFFFCDTKSIIISILPFLSLIHLAFLLSSSFKNL